MARQKKPLARTALRRVSSTSRLATRTTIPVSTPETSRKNDGKFGVVIHGLLLGRLSMPATVDGEQGKMLPWTVLIIELLSESTASYPVAGEPDSARGQSGDGRRNASSFPGQS